MSCTGGSVPYSARIEVKDVYILCFNYFIKTNPPEEMVQVLLSGTKLSDKSPNIFVILIANIDRYMQRPRAIFWNGKYCITDDFCYKVFFACYIFENKLSKTSEYKPDKLDDNLFQNSHEGFSLQQSINNQHAHS